MERRKVSPEIVAIHERLDKLEDISSDIQEIKEWIATVVKVTRGLEVIGCFMSRWAMVWLKITAAIAFTWAYVKYGVIEGGQWLRGFLGK